MTTFKRQIQLKLKKFDELMIELKIKYVDDKSQKEFEDDLEYRSALKDSVKTTHWKEIENFAMKMTKQKYKL